MIKQIDIFGDEKEGKAKHFYNKYDLMSWFLKSLRIGAKEQSIEILHIMLNEGLSEWYIAKKLVHFASEDAVGAEAFNYAMNVFLLIKEVKSEVNSLSRLILYLCNAPKMWESEEEHTWEVKRIQIRERIKKCYALGKKPREMAGWVWDRYTAKGKAKWKKGDSIDERFSGVLKGSGLFCRALFLRDGGLFPDKSEKKDLQAPHILHCEGVGMTIDEYLKEHNLSPEEFLSPLK